MAAQAREKPGVYKTFPEQFCLRLSKEQTKRLKAAAEARSKSYSDFVRDCVMQCLNGFEEEQRVRKQREVEEEQEAFVPRNVRPSRGLGLRPTMEVSSPPASPAPPVQQQPTTIIVNTPSPSTGRDELDLLVDYVLAARNTVDSNERKRVVTNMILSSTTDKAEQVRLAKTLDEKLQVKAPKKSGWSLLGGSR